MYSLLADESVTDKANAYVAQGEPQVAETATIAAIGAEDQPSDTAAAAAAGPSILVFNDLWRYVPAYFQTVDAVEPRSEAGRRLLERRRRQMERQQQQQRKSDTTAAEVGENQRGTLPVDQLLAYITNSATPVTSATRSAASYKGRRKKKQLTASSDAVVDGCSSSKNDQDDADDSREEKVLRDDVGKTKLQPDNATAGDIAGGDAADFVVVRRGRRCRPAAAERPTKLQTEVPRGRQRHKPTFCDSLDEFSLQDNKVTTPTASHVDDNKDAESTVVGERSTLATTILSSTTSLQTSPLSIKTTHPYEVSGHRANLDNQPTCESQRPVTLRCSNVVKQIAPNRQEKLDVVDDTFTESSTNNQQKEPRSKPASEIDCVSSTNSSRITNEKDGEFIRVSTTDVQPVDLSTTSMERNSSTRHRKHIAGGRVVETISCSTQTSSVEMPRYSTSPTSSDSTAVLDGTGNRNLSGRSNPVVFLDANNAKADNSEVLRESSELSFGLFDDIPSTSLGSESRVSEKVTAKSASVGRCSDAATSPIKLSPLTSSSPTLETKPLTVASHGRRITPLCRTTGSASSASGAPVGIVPPIMHVETTSGDANVSADEHSTREEVSHLQYGALMCGL